MSSYALPLDMLYKWEQETPQNIYMRQPINGEWHQWSWYETGQQVRRMAAYLKSLDLSPASKVGILSKNCAHWMFSDLAIMMAGHVSVPLYPNLSADSLEQILIHSETSLLFVGKLDDFEKMRPGIPASLPCIAYPFYSEEGYPTWNECIAELNPLTDNVARDPEELATIIYTSGTTGMPKGVMHKFFNFGFATVNAVSQIQLKNTERFFSYLPLCHIAERLLVEMGSLYTGGRVS